MFSADNTLGCYRWPVVRLPAKTSVEVVLLSPRFFALTTHWYKCTVPCSVDDCELCELLPSRGLFYVAVLCASSVRLLELGAQSSADLEQHCKLMHGSMEPGLVLEICRRAAKSPVRSEIVGMKEGVQAPAMLMLAQRVMAVYKFPPPNPSESIEAYEVRLREAAKLRNRRLAREILSPEKRGT